MAGGLDTTALGNGLSNGLDLTPTGSVIGTTPDGTPIDNAVLAQGDRAGFDLAAQDGAGSKVDLLQEEQNGGHTLEKHVGMSDAYLLNRITTEQYGNWIYSERLASAGSFYSLDQANALTNATLNLNSATVNSVANGNFGTVPQVVKQLLHNQLVKKHMQIWKPAKLL